MALPEYYTEPTSYFKEAIDFLSQYAWIYQYSNTNFIKAGVLDKMSKDWKKYFNEIEINELNQFPLVFKSLENLKITELLEFRHQLVRLIPLESFNEVSNIFTNQRKNYDCHINFKHMNPKKKHEILQLGDKINSVLSNNRDGNNIEKILIDLGSGLGYLHSFLLKNYKILGLESNEKYTQKANLLKQLENSNINYSCKTKSISNIVYKEHEVTENSNEFIVNSIEKIWNISPIVKYLNTWTIIGLHSCADLTITAIRLFFKITQVKHLIIVSCCYHKLQSVDDKTDSELKFNNFPLSNCLKNIIESFGNVNFLNRQFLRLACQQSLQCWLNKSEKEHQQHGFEMFERAIADAIIDKEFEYLRIQKRQKSRREGDIETDFRNFSQHYELVSKINGQTLKWTDKHLYKYKELFKKYSNGSKLAEGLTCLQTALQKLCENVILYDRLCYMKEMANKLDLKIKVYYEKIFDERLSPRCQVLIAQKIYLKH